MTIWRTLCAALLGWRAIIAGNPDWANYFTVSGMGFIRAVAIFVLTALVVTLFSTVGASIAQSQIIGSLIIECLSIVALGFGAILLRVGAPKSFSMRKIMVPGVYALIGFMVLRANLVALGGPFALLALLVLGYFFYRLGRVSGGASPVLAVGFAVLTQAALVVMPWSLYMLTQAALASS